tara:strand:+ start:217 stop:483 length:267 start_codon:yes stop_codon:yes gene_type:complete
MTQLTYELTGEFIHGPSFAMHMSKIDFITWRRNVDTGAYWIKFHSASGKEIRIQTSLKQLNHILEAYSDYQRNEPKLKYVSDAYELDY